MIPRILDLFTVTIDDDPLVSRMIEAILELPSVAFASGHDFLANPPATVPVGVFVDVHLGSGDSGIDLVPALRERWPQVPIIMVTSDKNGDTVWRALAAGADDYIKKPLDKQELKARLSVRTRELAERSRRETVSFGDLEANSTLNEVSGPGGTAYLSHRDMRLLTYLIESKSGMLSRQDLKQKLWGALVVSENALDKKLSTIRQALKEVGSAVKLRAVYGKGFALVAPSSDVSADQVG